MKKTIIAAFLTALLIGCGKPENESKTESERIDSAQIDDTPKIIIATGKIEPQNGIINVSAPVGGIVEAVLKMDGDSVVQGQTLVQLVDDIEQSKINEIRSQIQTQRSQIVVEQTQIEEAEVNLHNKQDLMLKTKRLVESGAEAQQVYDDLTTEVKIRQVNVDRAKASAQLAKSRLTELTAQLHTAETEARLKVFKAPSNGILLDINLKKGEAVNQFSNYAEFVPRGSLNVRAQVDELYSSKVKIGQQVDIVYRGSDEVIATGEVTMVAAYLKKKSIFSEKTDDQEDRRVREIQIALKNTGGLIINSKVECKIKL
jgi:multidrug resistance efflux pump